MIGIDVRYHCPKCNCDRETDLGCTPYIKYKGRRLAVIYCYYCNEKLACETARIGDTQGMYTYSDKTGLDVLSKLEKFFESNIFKRISSAINVKREMRFLTELSVSKIAPHIQEKFCDEKVIVQGAVDVCFEEEDGIVILDFKTDRVEDISLLAETYGEQLNIYANACQKIYEKPVKQKIIYSFFKGKEIEV